MDDTRVANALRAYVANEPPTRLTSHSVLAAGRKSRRRHRIAAVGTTLGGVVAAGAIALLIVPGLVRGPGSGAAGSPMWTELDPSPFCAVAATPAPSATPPGSSVVSPKNGFRIPLPSEPTAHAAARLSCFLLRTVPGLLSPTTRFALAWDAPPGVIPLQVSVRQGEDPASYSGGALVAGNSGFGEIAFGVSPTWQSTDDAVATCIGPCTVHTGPHGEVMTVVSIQDNGYYRINVEVYQGNSITSASASNGDLDGRVPPVGQDSINQPFGRPDLPLSLDQLIEIAAAPDLALH
jgi:hypothetical protein